jgi:hypothetical protein
LLEIKIYTLKISLYNHKKCSFKSAGEPNEKANHGAKIKETAGLFKNVQMQGAQKTESRGVYRHTSSGAVCSATQQMSVFQQFHSDYLLD